MKPQAYLVRLVGVGSSKLRHGPSSCPRSECFANLGRKLATCANRGESNHLHKRARRYYLFANDYFKDPVLGALPSTTGAKIRISRDRQVRCIPNDDGLLPPFPANGT